MIMVETMIVKIAISVIEKCIHQESSWRISPRSDLLYMYRVGQNKTSKLSNAAISSVFNIFLINFQCLLFIYPESFCAKLKVIRLNIGIWAGFSITWSKTESTIRKIFIQISDQWTSGYFLFDFYIFLKECNFWVKIAEKVCWRQLKKSTICQLFG